MHEGVPSISFDPGRQLMDTCHSDVAGGVERPSVVEKSASERGRNE
jgi:hypothetical protein